MSVEARFRLSNAERTNLTMEVTMTLAEWEELHAVLDSIDGANREPFWTLRHRMRALTDFAQKHFTDSSEAAQTAEMEHHGNN